MASAAPEQIGQNKMFGGYSRRFKHQSDVLGCSMTFTIYLPPAAEAGKVPIIYFLSGLTCTDDNFTTKAGAQRKAAELGVALVAPDTSPRGLGVEGEADSWDFGVGAGEGGCAHGGCPCCLHRTTLWKCSYCSAEDRASCPEHLGSTHQAAPAQG
jgi:S-formylglutathione hydrolase FrmB